MKTFTLVTFGCKVNQYESQALREAFAGRGMREAAPGQNADLILVNTCAVTETAAAEARRTVRRLARRHPRAEITVTGCAAESDRTEYLRAPAVREVVPQARKAALADAARPGIFDLSISRFKGHARAFLKVQDGCDLHCSFCIVPQVRGPSASRALEGVLEEARRLVAQGYAEIVLTGVHLGSYRGGVATLARKVLEVPGLGRLRLSSIEANEIDDRLVDLMANEPRLCPHLHIPLQSGDDAVLRAMRRRYGVRRFEDTCAQVAGRVPDPSFTTDIIVGFPGETEAQFENTLEACRRVGFSRIHVFPYSRRPGTDAAERPDLPEHVKKERLHRVKRLAAELTAAYARRFTGHEIQVLVERNGGYTERYLQARVSGAPGTIVRARVERTERGVLHAMPV